MPVFQTHRLLLALSVVIAQASLAPAGLVWMPAFPGAEGFGAKTIGGRGGTVIEVTTLADSGPGSLRAAIDASGPRIVVFRVGGTIELQSSLVLFNPYITIAGQTAPGGGIGLKNAQFFNRYQDPSATLDIRTHEVILRHVRLRPGPITGNTTGNEVDAIQIYGPAYNLMLDHCTLSWAVDENFSSWSETYDWTMQWCISSEGLLNAGHSEGAHSMGLLVGSEGSRRISIHHNLLAHDKDRNPRIKTSGIVDYINNVMYNFGEFAGLLSSDYADMPFNYVANYVRPGLDSGDAYELAMWEMNGHVNSAYVEGNIGPHRADDTQPNNNVVDPGDRPYVVSTRFDAVPVITDTAVQAWSRVPQEAGATLPTRDSADLRIINDVKNGTGRIINNPSQVGGWPVIPGGTPPPDADHDGMPDTWESLHTLNPDSATDGPLDLDGDGYTNVEEFLNGTTPTVDPLCGVRLTAYNGSSLDGATLTRAGIGRPCRTDRADTLVSLPAGYECAIMVRSPAADATSTDAALLSILLGSNATVAVAYDARATTVPAWLSAWTAPGQTLSIRERGTTEQTVQLNLRTKTFTAGQSVTLGGNRAGGGNAPAAYVVLIAACSPPMVQFTQEPVSQLIYQGQMATLSAPAQGEGLIRYQWRKNGVDLTDSARYSGTLSATLSISNFVFSDAGTYQVFTTDLWCGASSAQATLTYATPCDFNRDGDVDQEDFGHFQDCIGASGLNPACADARLDGDFDVDTDDFTLFQACMSGPDVTAPARCLFGG